MRNLVLIHFESLSELTYRMDYKFFPIMKKWEQKSLLFSNYFSTATSTFMVMSDLAFGDMMQFEQSDKYCMEPDKKNNSESVFDRLQEEGYCVRVIEYSAICDAYLGNDNHFIGDHTRVEHFGEYGNFLDAADETMSGKRPFVLWVYDVQNNIDVNYEICCANKDGKNDGLHYEERLEGYRHLNRMTDDIMTLLESKDLIANTSVIFYGDHGDDLFIHGWHSGYSHAIEPYLTLIKTPLWIFDSRIIPHRNDALIDTTDIKRIILNILKSPQEKNLSESDLGILHKNYSFSRNMYAAQMVRKDSFNKGYSITNGEYLLLLSNLGLSMYYICLDSISGHNLLDYFEYEDGELTFNESVYASKRGHFGKLFGSYEIDRIRITFYELKEVLTERIRKAYKFAEREEFLSDLDFEHIQYSLSGLHERERAVRKINYEYDFARKFFEGKKVVLYGAGKEGVSWYLNLYNDVDIVAWIDKDYLSINKRQGVKISSVDVLKRIDFDCIIITIYSPGLRKEVKDMLVSKGIDRKNIY
ncbi:MAG: sulfatase-like hydrolase/transferase [Lachnospiraceae bacterium]|nr:sulfatase-like hydrolase/transferase [Lachnospiraceae bacterium]